MDGGEGANLLLYGATGSGKTEVYLQACAAALERGLGSIVLVPEIALTPQTLGRFRARFGERVALLHSGLSDAERRDERERIATRRGAGRRRRALGGVRAGARARADRASTRSTTPRTSRTRIRATTPAPSPRSARRSRARSPSTAARRRGPRAGPRLERLALGGRLGAALPPVRVVDLRREAGYPLSAPLLRELGRVAEHGGKAILLLNRRGIAPALHCRACGTTPPLRPAATSRSSSMPTARLHCHHCGFAEPAPETCPECGSSELARLGAGTQRLERELAAALPELVPIRLDADTAARPRRARRGARAVRRDRPRRAGRHADGREGPPLQRRRARRGRRRRHGPRRSRTSAPRSAPSSS